MSRDRLFRWQGITIASLFTGYAGYYVCRSNLSVATPLLLSEYAGSGLTKEDLGLVASAGVLAYAVGKVSNGLLADFLGGRLLFLTGMFASVAFTILFGLSGSLVAFTLLWAGNRYVQSMGWGGLVKIAAHWFPLSRQATVMGLLSMSYLLGDALARLFLGTVVRLGADWRSLFFAAAATLGAIALACTFTVRNSPTEIGEPEPDDHPENVFGTEGGPSRPESVRQVFLFLARNVSFWLACVLCMGLTLIRETFNFWSPTFLKEVVGMDAGRAGQWSLLFPLVGGASALLAGWITDQIQGKFGRIVVPSLLLLVLALVLLAYAPLEQNAPLALMLLAVVAFFLLGPFTFCSGLIPLTLGGKRGSASAAGLIDSAGYLGAVLSGYGVGSLVQNRGWSTAFLALAVTAALAAGAAVAYWIVQEVSAQPGSKETAPTIRNHRDTETRRKQDHGI